MMSQYPKDKWNYLVGALCGTGALIALVATAYAGQSLVRDRRVSLEEARRLAHSSLNGDGFPIVVNESVLAQLNRFVGTPDGRAFMREALGRMESYRPMIEQKIRFYGLPEELLAVPIIESSYKNFKRNRVAGLWMFIETTARHYNLEVDGAGDDRLNPPLETDAAMRLLGADYLRFQDWCLALLAYNAGEGHVQDGIDATGSRDAWKLVQSGFDNDKDYLPMVMAAVIVLKNPAILD